LTTLIDVVYCSNCRQKTTQYNIKWINQDIRCLQLKGKFDCVICPCDGFNYITEIDELKTVLGKIINLLNDEGLLIFDISSKYKLSNILGNNTFAESFEDNAYIWENFYDDTDQICEFEVTTFERDGLGFRRYIEYHRQKAYDASSIEKVLEEIGFEKINITSDYTQDSQMQNNSERLVFTCFKG